MANRLLGGFSEFLHKRNQSSALHSFVESYQAVYSSLSRQNNLPTLTVSILPIELPLIYQPFSVHVVSLPNLDGEDFIQDRIANKIVQRLNIGINKNLGVDAQIQSIIRMTINAIERSNTFDPSQLRRQSAQELETMQQDTDRYAERLATDIINSVTSEKPSETFNRYLRKTGTNVELKIRTLFIGTEKSRQERYRHYQEMYDSIDFVRSIVDNMVSVTTGRGFKFGTAGPESSASKVLSILYEFATKEQLQKSVNHVFRDSLVYGDGYLLRETFSDEMSIRLLRPQDVKNTNEGYLVEVNGNSVLKKKGEVLNFQHLIWDDSGYGVSELEPLLAMFLMMKNWSKLRNEVEEKLHQTFILEQQIQLSKMSKDLQRLEEKEREKMKEVVSDPTVDYVKTTRDLYFK